MPRMRYSQDFRIKMNCFFAKYFKIVGFACFCSLNFRFKIGTVLFTKHLFVTFVFNV